MSTSPPIEVTRSRTRHRFEITVDGHVAGFAAYRLLDGGVEITHTEIDAERGGQGLGSRLVRDALNELAAQGLAVLPTCPFVAEYLRRHHVDGLRVLGQSATDPAPPSTRPVAAPQLLPQRIVPLGGLRGIEVCRSLPQRALPTVGAWCFLDKFAPSATPMRVPPHPHTGLQTVTYLFTGALRHRDSLGTDVVIRPGEVNLMTAGHGVSHSEFSITASGSLPGPDDQLEEPAEGVQLWVALPDAVRDMAPAFEHHDQLPIVQVGDAQARVLVGQLGDARSPVSVHSELLGVDVEFAHAGAASLGVDRAYEYAVLVTQGQATVNGVAVEQGTLAWLGVDPGALELSCAQPARLLVLGGVPLDEDLVMWWNFVARTHDEIVAQRQAWQDEDPRFGYVEGYGEPGGESGKRIPAPQLPHVRLAPRRRSSPASLPEAADA